MPQSEVQGTARGDEERASLLGMSSSSQVSTLSSSAVTELTAVDCSHLDLVRLRSRPSGWRDAGQPHGYLDPLGMTAVQDYKEDEKWAAKQPWSSGKVGPSGSVSLPSRGE